MIKVFLAALTLAALPALDAAFAGDPTGLWLTQKKGVIVNLYECGDDGALCGRTVWMKRMVNKDGSPRIDAKNPEPSLRSRHWCGIEVISDVKPAGDGAWKGGEIYDPKTGDTFDFDISERGDGLKVRGYLGLPLLGKSETWTRTDGAGVSLCEGA
ncbi:MAG: DUF2147 domain-containing protein [Pseudomonadota bacterium]